MDYIRDALVRMVKAERQAYRLWDAINAAGYDDSSYFEIAGNIGDAIEAMHKNYEQPKPTFMNRKAFRKSVKQNGGYITPEGEWT